LNTHHRIRSPGAALTIAVVIIILIVFSFTVTAGESSITGTIVDDNNGMPIPNAHITITFRGNGTLVAETTTNAEGKFWVTDLDDGLYRVLIQAEDYKNWTREIDIKPDTYGGEHHTFTGRMSPIAEPDDPVIFPNQPFFAPLIIVAVLAVSSLVLYSKIRRENLLKHAVRSRIFDHIRDKPGAHYRAILNELGLTMGVLTYHLNVLEKAEYLRSRQDGMYRRFFVTGRKTEVRFFLTDIQESIVNVIRDNQGISQSRIADRINVSRKVVNYHVRILDQAGLIYMESKGREMACFIVDRAGMA
jgi:DNA-binding MarR family transcriptional regulator